jgi:hypothetical protein
VVPPDRENAGDAYWPTLGVERLWEGYQDPDVCAGLDLCRANSPWSRIADLEAKVRLLDEYDTAMRSGTDLSYDHRTGRHSYAQCLWGVLCVLADGYRGREGWRERWPLPARFQ